MSVKGQERVLSGMRPSGKLHLGHLHGVLNNWKRLQDDYSCFFFVADWHALTTNYKNAWEVPGSIHDMVLDWLSVGIDPDKAVLFVQSDVKAHAELQVLFSMITPLSWLERNPTYKEQQQELKEKDISTYGFLGYPVLQAADIVIYKANKVPVGIDQLPHVELTREITRRFNYLYGEVFPVPEALLAEVPKLPGLDGRKMSKSYGNSIFISDDEKTVREKMMTIVTDVERPRKSDPGDPEKRCVAFNMHKLYIEQNRLQEIVEDCQKAKLGCVACKKGLAEAVVKNLEPVWERRAGFAEQHDHVEDILAAGAKKGAGDSRSYNGRGKERSLEPECRISVADFEGPLDLLLYLINRNRLDITDIPIALVTRQYLDYLEIIKAFNVAVAGEYLVMAATLIQIKSRMLLPVPEPEPDDDPRLEITGPLQELASIRALASRMDSMPMLGRDVFFRGKAVFEASVPCEPAPSAAYELTEVKVADLIQAMERVLDRASSDMALHVDRERISLEARMGYVMDRLSEAGGRMVFFDMFEDSSRGVVIVTFLAILELANRTAIYILQKEHGGDIILLSRT